VIDGAAFKIYGHWVKKNDGQNRAAMFEHSPKVDQRRALAAEEAAAAAAAQNANKVVFIVDGEMWKNGLTSVSVFSVTRLNVCIIYTRVVFMRVRERVLVD